MEINTEKEYEASQILKKKILIKFLLLDKVNTILKWVMITFLAAMIVFFILIKTGIILDQGAYDQVNFAHIAFYWPLIVIIIYVCSLYVESIYTWEAQRRQKAFYDREGFANVDFMIRKTKFRILVHIITLLIVGALFGLWFFFINRVHPNAGRIFFDPAFGSQTDGVDSVLILRIFGLTFIAATALIIGLGILYIITTIVVLRKTKEDVALFREIKDSVIEHLDVEPDEDFSLEPVVDEVEAERVLEELDLVE